MSGVFDEAIFVDLVRLDEFAAYIAISILGGFMPAAALGPSKNPISTLTKVTWPRAARLLLLSEVLRLIC